MSMTQPQRTLHAVTVVAALLVIAGCGAAGTDSGGGEAAEAPAVEALPAREGSLPLEQAVSGVVRARNQVAIRSEISAAVVEVLVRNGDPVVAGQPLVRLDDAVLADRLRSAEAELRVAEATEVEAHARVEEIRARVVRNRALAAEGLTSPLDLETFEAQLAAAEAGAGQAEARVEQARATAQERSSALAKATVRAPVAGFVGRRDVEVGMVVGPSDVLFVVGDLDDLIIEVPLTQEMLGQVEVGSPVEIDARESEDAVVAAAISRISPFLEAESFSTVAEIDVPGDGSGLRPGMFVTVRVQVGARDRATLVPASALWEDPPTGDWTVFVLDDAAGLAEPDVTGGEIPDAPRTVRRRFVSVLAEGRGQTAVTGVDGGEWVVTLGQHLLQERLDADGGDVVSARVRAVSWPFVLDLQGLQREDLLDRFLTKQRAVAHALGAELPESTAQVDEVLRAAADAAAANGGQGN